MTLQPSEEELTCECSMSLILYPQGILSSEFPIFMRSEHHGCGRRREVRNVCKVLQTDGGEHLKWHVAGSFWMTDDDGDHHHHHHHLLPCPSSVSFVLPISQAHDRKCHHLTSSDVCQAEECRLLLAIVGNPRSWWFNPAKTDDSREFHGDPCGRSGSS